ncbi:LTR-retrotransposon skipper [Tieghemostelium lacteum]|uniref:Gag3-Pol3 n=1 Tax=Tieghemostelium lacteum TaxID=361077 RepID=A0A152A408_TIELA|nr:LTR-retrotransposon skipper [Tieghemostelium lacteum]KYR01002.1 LTR-retrotransposon skipper [Tieghemostelium lacteum]|eukprot:KYQ96678.1 LTR-retrotransposon skipper [Tieghemostelium lacteum]
MSSLNKNESNLENTIMELKKELENFKSKKTEEDEIKKGLSIIKNLPFYEGNQDEDLEIFLQEFNDAMLKCGIKTGRGYLLSLKLKGNAKAWYYGVPETERKTVVYDDLIKGLKVRFNGISVDIQARMEMDKLHQENCSSIREYIAKFENLKSKIGSGRSDKDYLYHFKKNLSSDIRIKLATLGDLPLTSVMQAAIATYENQQMIQESSKRNMMEVDSIHRRERSHYSKPRPPTCFACGKLGHIAKYCQSRGSTEIKDNKISTIEALEQDYPKCVNTLILKGAIKKKVCEMLVDTGSSLNIIDTDFAEKKGFPVEKCKEIEASVGNNQTVKIKGLIRNVNIEVKGKVYQDSFYVMKTNQDIILGKPWITKHKPILDWNSYKVIGFEEQGKKVLMVNSVKELNMKEDRIFKIMLDKVVSIQERIVQEPIEEEKKLEKLRKEFLERFKDIISEGLPKGVPPDRGVAHKIEIEEGVHVRNRPLPPLTNEELDELKKQLNELIDLGLIRPSKSPYGATVLFAKKKDGGLRLCIDYRPLNQVTKKNATTLPTKEDLMGRTNNAKYFTKIDLRGGYWQIPMDPKDIEKTAIKTRYGNFEFLVMPFGLTNGPATFMTLMNKLFLHCVDKFVVIFLDDILIYSKTLDDHFNHVKEVLEILRDAKLIVHSKKSKLFQTRVEFLGHVISRKGIEVCDDKIQSIKEWPVPINVKEVQSFLGLCNYYRQFVPNYSQTTHYLTSLVEKNKKFVWMKEHQNAFEELKHKLCNTRILAMPTPMGKYRIETDASDFAVGAVLKQEQNNEFVTIGFESRKLNKAEKRYSAYDRELVAVIHALKKWRRYIHGKEIEIFTDHQPLTRILEQPMIQTTHQARRIEFLSEFNIKFKHIDGKANVVADALSRRPDYETALEIKENKEVLKKIKKLYVQDVHFQEAFYNAAASDTGRAGNFQIINEVLYYVKDQEKRMCIPNDKEVKVMCLSEIHSQLYAGHFGYNKTYEQACRYFYWPGLDKDVKKFVDSCPDCQRNKTNSSGKQGLLQSIEPPSRRWSVITMDFVVALPKSNGFDSVLTVTDKSTKMVHLIPTTSNVTADGVAKLFIDNIWRLHGIPKVIISDRDPKFTSNFWKSFTKRLGINQFLSTAFHPQTDGQSERTNRTMEQILRNFVNYKMDNWSELLSGVEFSINNAINASTKYSPFFLNFGQHPIVPSSILIEDPENESSNFVVEEFIKNIKSASQASIDSQSFAQRQQAKYSNTNRSDVTFEVGDQVLLSTENITLSSDVLRPKKKLTGKYCGPFEIIEKISPVNYKLKLPHDMKKLHPVFHVSLLKEYVSNPEEFQTRVTIPPPPVIISDEIHEYEVEKVLDHRKYYGKNQYLVKWVGFADHENSWVDEVDISKGAIKEFHNQNLEKDSTEMPISISMEGGSVVRKETHNTDEIKTPEEFSEISQEEVVKKKRINKLEKLREDATYILAKRF